MGAEFSQAVAELIRIGKDFHERGWVNGTSGNFSTVLDRNPLRLAITASGADKGDLAEERFLEIDAAGHPIRSAANKPSDEHRLHLEVVATRDAGSVLHTHSVWSTLLSDRYGAEGGVALEGYEMLKGLSGVRTHQHREWVPILENDQDMAALAIRVRVVLQQTPQAHAFLLRRHGLYSWGKSIREAKRHVEILEFLLEVEGRSKWRSSESPSAG